MKEALERMRYLESSLMTEGRWRGVRYLLAGGLNTGLGMAMIGFFMYELMLPPELANQISYGIGIFTSYFLNRHLTFRSRESIARELAKFVLVYITAFIANLLVLWILVRQIEIQTFIAQLVAMLVFVITSYSLQALFVFSRE
jgi:putative flippase GtrA